MKPKQGVTLGGPTLSWTTKRKLLATCLFCLSLATPGVARLKQNRPVARSFRLVVHDGVGSASVTLSFGFIVRLLGYGNLLAKCMKPEMEAARTTERRTPTQWFAWKPL